MLSLIALKLREDLLDKDLGIEKGGLNLSPAEWIKFLNLNPLSRLDKHQTTKEERNVNNNHKTSL
jgi:hypothetical protein